MSNDLIGLLIFDKDQKADWRQKVIAAGEVYHQKFWIRPNGCFVNSKTISPDVVHLNDTLIEEIDGIQVYTRADIQPNNYFVFHRAAKSEATKTEQQDQVTQPALF